LIVSAISRGSSIPRLDGAVPITPMPALSAGASRAPVTARRILDPPLFKNRSVAVVVAGGRR
jgi:hypothetical protein